MNFVNKLYSIRNRCRPDFVLPTFAILFISLAGFAGTQMLVPARGWGSGAHVLGEGVDTFEGRFVRWDSGYYLQIAQDGYQPTGAERAFFPLYPLLVRLIHAGSHLSLLWSGWVVSVICFVLAGVILYKWMLAEYGPTSAWWCLAWFSFFPVSFFNIAFYPSSLYLLASIASIFCARRGRFVASGLCIAVAGAARPEAFLLAVPFATEFISQHRFSVSRWLWFGCGLIITPLGMLGYGVMLASYAGTYDPLGVYNANLAVHWQMSTVWPWVALRDELNAVLFGAHIGSDWFSRATVWQDLLYMLGGLILAVWTVFKLRLSLSLFFLTSMLFYASSHGPYGYVFEGMPRHVASIFPIYIVLGLAMRRISWWLHWLLLALSGVLLGLLSAWFASGRWVS